jgi:hypothetical protein
VDGFCYRYYEGEFKDDQPTGTGKIVLADGEVLHLKCWRQVFPGVRGKQLKKKRRASKDSDKLVAHFKQLAEETLRTPAAKIPRAAMRASAVEVEE